MILPSLFIAPAGDMGRGVFTSEKLKKNTIVEITPVLVMSSKERELIDRTLLQHYIFEWGHDKKQCCMGMGYVSFYNHKYISNCEYEMDYDEEIIQIKALRTIKAGEELFINYNGTWNDSTPLWFDAK